MRAVGWLVKEACHKLVSVDLVNFSAESLTTTETFVGTALLEIPRRCGLCVR